MTEFNRRSWLENRFQELYVGQFEEMAGLDDDSLESMVSELETAQKGGLLDLETDSGMALLQEIVDRYTNTEALGGPYDTR
jgi:hypothetical protein